MALTIRPYIRTPGQSAGQGTAANRYGRPLVFIEEVNLESNGNDSPLPLGIIQDRKDQLALFDMEPEWKKLWVGMPEFIQEDLSPWKTISLHFASPGDMWLFSELVGQKLTENTRSIWYPPAEIGHYANKRYADEP